MEASKRVRLSKERQKVLNQQKRAARVTNERFFRVHPELRAMLSSFLASLLEQKPPDILEYASDFFTDPLLAKKLGYEGYTRPVTPTGGLSSRLNSSDASFAPEQPKAAVTGEGVYDLEVMLVGLFKEADQDGNGYLDRQEFERLMQTSELNLSSQEVRFLLAEADENMDGQISYAVRSPHPTNGQKGAGRREGGAGEPHATDFRTTLASQPPSHNPHTSPHVPSPNLYHHTPPLSPILTLTPAAH